MDESLPLQSPEVIPPPPPKPSLFFPILLSSLVTILIMVIGYLLYQHFVNPKVSETTERCEFIPNGIETPALTSNFQSCVGVQTSKNNGYTFECPKNWFLDNHSEESIQLRSSESLPEEPDISVGTIRIETDTSNDYADMTLDNYIKYFSAGGVFENSNSEPKYEPQAVKIIDKKVIDGISGYTATWGCCGGVNYGFIALNNGRATRISLAYPAGLNEDEVLQKWNQSLDQILTTFKFSDPASDWKTYNNSRYHYQLKYPGHLSITEEDGTFDSQLAPGQKLQQTTLKDKDLSINIYFEGGFDHGFDPWELDNRENIILEGKPAIKTILTSLESDNLWIIYTIEDFHSFRIEVTTSPNNENIVDQILSTLTFD